MFDDSRSLIDLIREHLATTRTQIWVNPGIALEIQQTLHNPGFSIDHLAGLVLRDRALPRQILKMANSAFFSGVKKVGTIRGAIVRMGAKQILKCVMVVTQKNLYRSNNEEINRHLTLHWRHAFGCAVGTRWLIEKIGYRELAQEGFLAGLLQDIGKLFLLNVLDRLHRAGKLQTDLSGALVREILASLHTEYGYRLLAQWNLSRDLCRGGPGSSFGNFERCRHTAPRPADFQPGLQKNQHKHGLRPFSRSGRHCRSTCPRGEGEHPRRT